MSDIPVARALHVPSYMTARSLARELDISEAHVYTLVRTGVLPKPIRLSTGCVRWSWSSVQAALASLEDGAGGVEADPFLQGIDNAIKAKEGRRATA